MPMHECMQAAGVALALVAVSAPVLAAQTEGMALRGMPQQALKPVVAAQEVALVRHSRYILGDEGNEGNEDNEGNEGNEGDEGSQ